MRVIVAGDFSPINRIVSLFDNGRFSDVLEEIHETVLAADYSLVNFESPVVVGDVLPIEKCGPNLRCSPNSVRALKWCGFNCVTLANNHFFDYGEQGIVQTLQSCEKEGVDTVGGGMNLREASATLYKKIGDEAIAVINCCEHEFSVAEDTSAGANPLSPIQQYYAIKEAQTKANYVLVIVHGGHEHYNLPSPRMQEIYRFFIDAGADAVVNHHQHCYSGFEVYKGKPIFYGLGNFCFDRMNDFMPSAWYDGYMVELDFAEDKEIGYKLIPYSQCKEKPVVESMSGEHREHFFNEIKRLNAIITNPIELKVQHDKWMHQMGNGFKIQFTPWTNRWLVAAYEKHLLPSFLTKKKILTLLNHIECESHNERTILALKELLEKK